MFISVLELFKVGIGPSSSHTMGPMVAAHTFINLVREQAIQENTSIRCTLKDSLAHTGVGHSTDLAIILGLHNYLPESLSQIDIEALSRQLRRKKTISLTENFSVGFDAKKSLIFDKQHSLPQHPNGMIFDWLDSSGKVLLSKTYCSIGGGFVTTLENIGQLQAPMLSQSNAQFPYAFDSADTMLQMSKNSGLSIAQMKYANETQSLSKKSLERGLDKIWQSMEVCIEKGLQGYGILSGGLNTPRRAKNIHQQLTQDPDNADVNDWLCAYAMAVNEENASGHMVVTAPTNGAAGIIPALLYYLVHHQNADQQKIYGFLLTAAAIGGLIKHRSSISGAEVGCQGEVGSASSMAAAGLCAVKGGTTAQIENAAEIALEHHLGLTCDPVKGLVQIPCIERNGFGAISAYLAASLALKENGEHLISLDRCIETMKKTGIDMSSKYKETSLGGLALSMTEC
jgi:L-serine dehydratase